MAIKGTLAVILFKDKDDNIYITYCPALDLYGYGNTETEAKESLRIVLNEFFDYTTKKKTLEKELIKLGWVTKNKRSKKLTPPNFTESIIKSKELQKIVNNYNITKYESPLPIEA